MPISILIQSIKRLTVAVLFLSVSPQISYASLDKEGLLPRKNDRALENISGVDTHYGSVEVASGLRLRTLISHPEGLDQPLYPLLFTQWVSCGSIELKAGDGGKMGLIARESGLALLRVDRAGSGDSQGPGCDKLDYNTEVQHYISAFESLLKDPKINPSKIYLLGESLGSTTAPLVAKALQEKGHNIEAIVVQGGGALTHLERMINFDRIYLERRPTEVSRADIHSQMNHRIAFHTEYLAKGRHPNEIAKDSPEMMAIRNDVRGLGRDNHYGRPFAWHQQAATRNFLDAWASINAKVLVIFNEFDQFEMRHGHSLIVDTVNQQSPGKAELLVQKGLGHSSWRYDTKEAAYNDKGGKSASLTTGKAIVEWLRQVNKDQATNN